MEETFKGYYGICYSHEDPSSSTSKPKVVETKTELLATLKSYKDLAPRFKVFDTYEDALAYSSDSADLPPSFSLNNTTITNNNPEGPSSPFKSLSPQEMTQFRKSLEAGDDLTGIRVQIWENPRYLISSSDTPSIMHSGTRSNAFHVTAKTGKLSVMNILLEALQNPELLELLYPSESASSRRFRQDYILDNYLNLPDKGWNETPLHIAAKFGRIDIVKILVSFPSCNIRPLNRNGQTPADIACTRDGFEVKSEMLQALTGQVYIPVYRSMVEARVGEPWSPQFPTSNPIFYEDSNDRTLSTLSPIQSPYRFKRQHSPLMLVPSKSTGGIEKEVRVTALLGPVSPIDASKLQNEWKRSRIELRLRDPERGLETQGRQLASKYSIEWKEYWEFLNDYADFNTEEGLLLLDQHLERRTREIEKEEFGQDERELSYGFEELELNVMSPLSELAADMEALKIDDSSKSFSTKGYFNNNNRSSYIPVDPKLEIEEAEIRFADSVFSNIIDYLNGDQVDVAEFIMNCFSSPFAVFRRRVNNWKSDPKSRFSSLIGDESSLLKKLAQRVSRRLLEECSTTQVEFLLSYLNTFPKQISQEENSTPLTNYRDGGIEMLRTKYQRFETTEADLYPLCMEIESVLNDNDEQKIDDPMNNSMWDVSNAKTISTPQVNLARSFLQGTVFNPSFSSMRSERRISTSSESSYRTACSHLTDDDDDDDDDDAISIYTACEGFCTYIYGSEPSKTDHEVYLALENNQSDLDKYPFVKIWKDLVGSHNENDRAKWPRIPYRGRVLNVPKFEMDF